MQIEYELDKLKFVEVYNLLNISNNVEGFTLPELFDLYNTVKDNKILSEIKYGIDNNVNFKITELSEVKTIEDMYSYAVNPDRITPEDMLEAHKSISSVPWSYWNIGLGRNSIHLERQQGKLFIELFFTDYLMHSYTRQRVSVDNVESIITSVKERRAQCGYENEQRDTTTKPQGWLGSILTDWIRK